ncbi:TPR domain-containing protein [Pseudomassariella vexata]|uniref:TPR domain-containing protein n=1 Tax=Pseudomassariella vexata TaxID=1141098 RepID=A0A1Y2DJY0_9PEZI|nr:TPR domain-containing protein [Pseudomassariella vexata]ORY59456.1 TPR domain-containing protein [Pseudomassariella vexata]
MPATHIAAIRPLNGVIRSPLLRSRLQLLSPRPVCLSSHNGAAIVFVSVQQQRYESSERHKASEGRGFKEPPPKVTLRLLLRALRQNFNFRALTSAFRGQNLRNLYRQSPEELVLAVAILSCLSIIVLYVIYTYFNYFQAEQFTKFPPDVAKSLRRALYYSNYAPDPKLALKYYKIALEQCDQHGIDPFSDEVLGVKIQMAAWLEKIDNYQNAIDVLESILLNCKRWIDKMEQSVRAGQVDKSGMLIGAAAAAVSRSQGDVSDEDEGPPENLWAKRTRLLGKTVGISVKLGELYANEHVLQGDTAGERLIWAVETVLKELQRRQTEGVKEGEGEWMSPEQIGGALEALGNHYESKSQHYLAAPLYLQALTLSPAKTCHAAVLMNNLATSLAQQPISVPPAFGNLPEPDRLHSPAPPTRATLLTSARSWALQAYHTSLKVEGEDRTEECDEACAVALCNLGDIAAMSGDMEEAKKRFKASLVLSKKINFKAGIHQAQDGLAATGISARVR